MQDRNKFIFIFIFLFLMAIWGVVVSPQLKDLKMLYGNQQRTISDHTKWINDVTTAAQKQK